MPLQVELVAADALVWSGEASRVIARTTEGDLGVLPGHAPVLSVLVPGIVDVVTTAGESWIASIDGGFLSVAHDRVSILAERASISHDLTLEQAREELARQKAEGTV